MTRICVLLLLIGSLIPRLSAQARVSKRPEIVAYIFKRTDLIHPGEIAAEKLARINYAFWLIENGEIVNGYANDDQNLAALVALKQKHPSLKVLISVGGWLGSGTFSDMALTVETRRVFIESAVKFIERDRLDGFDIDGEYPAQQGAGNTFRAEDKHNYTLLCQELRKRFDEEQKRLRRPLLLTVAVGADSKFLENTAMGERSRSMSIR